MYDNFMDLTNNFALIKRSSLNHGSFFVSDSVSVMFDVSVLSVAGRHVHGADIVGVAQT